MKKLFLSLAVVCLFVLMGTSSINTLAAVRDDVEINEQNFPQKEFREEISKLVDHNKDNVLSKQEINQTTTLELHYPYDATNFNITGIEKLTNLKKVEIDNLNRKVGKIIGTFCGNKKLEVVVLKNGEYDLSTNEMSQLLPADQITVLTLDSMYVSKDALNNFSELKNLEIINSKQKTFNLNGLKNLVMLTTTDDKTITSIDLISNTKLETLDLNSKKLEQLYMPQKGSYSSITIDNASLKKLDLSGGCKLKELYIRNVPLNKLDLLHSKDLKTLTLNNTPIKKLNLTNNTKLKELEVVPGPSCLLKDLMTGKISTIEFYIHKEYSTKIVFPKKNHITKLIYYTTDKMLDISRCKVLKQINVSGSTKLKNR